ncbi:MAG: T9SS type A sorting domain-containing protein [Candidatus Cloacimonetes bacterium]|nr:T9SS type A sorting domain-containing protein [Candidatus Cloacimonadota bacterium]MCF7815153.1 T9SS type A sorting domain-containing protein [Candidatus Cloacimonadota bacterium]MCF7868018.1 T9SS type A sorting domain-containing protein [Candidatus Cloacimonadota bacterium]MCF7883476.1 T9SS type A sorting domain-containing protein [Candidatus Cloacimonadota bacterium]
MKVNSFKFSAIFFVFIFIIFPTILAAQTYWDGANIGTNENLNAIDYALYEGCIVVGDNGTIFQSYDPALYWNQIDSGTTVDLNDICFLNSSCAIAVGDAATILRSADSGETWTAINCGVTSSLLSVDINESGYGVIGGMDQTILWTDDFGETWSTVQTGFMGGGFEGAQILDDNTAFVFGSNSIFQPFVGRSTNNGASFSFYNFYFQQGAVMYEGKLFDGYFFDPTHGIAVGRRWDGFGCISTTSDLYNWTTEHFDTPFNGVDFDGSFGCVVGENGILYETSNGGTSWALHSSSTTENLNDIIITGYDHGYAVGNNGIIINKSHHQLPPPPQFTAEIQNYNNVFLNWASPSSGQTISHHNGYDYNGIGGPHEFECAARFDAVELQDFYGVGELVGVNITLYSTSYNQVFLKVYEGGCYGDPGTEIYCEDITGTVISGEMMYYTLDEPIPLLEGNEYWLGYEFIYASDHPAAVDAGPMVPDKGAWVGNYDNWDLLPNMAGVLDFNWIIEGVVNLTTDNSRWLLGYNVYRNDDLIEYIEDPVAENYLDESLDQGLYDYQIARVYDGGNTVISNIQTVDITFPIPYDLSATVNYPNILIEWMFDDDLRNFEDFNLYIDAEFFGQTSSTFYLLDPSLLEPGTHQLTITAEFTGGFESDHSEPLEIIGPNSANELPEIQTELIGNFPNPFNPTTEIRFSVTQSSAFATIEIYNLKGQKMKTLPVILSEVEGCGSPNSYSVIWKGDDDNNQPVASGIYFYKLKAGNFEQTKKCLLLK